MISVGYAYAYYFQRNQNHWLLHLELQEVFDLNESQVYVGAMHHKTAIH